MTTRKLEGEERKARIKEIISNPVIAHRMRMSMLGVFGEWACSEPEVIARIEKLTTEFKTIITACVEAKPDADAREVLLALDNVCLDFARAIALQEGQVEEAETDDVSEEDLKSMPTAGGVH